MRLDVELRKEKYFNTILQKYLDNNEGLSFLGGDYDKVIENIFTHKFDAPRKVLIPKDNGKFREIFVFSKIDRFYLKVINEVLYENHIGQIHRNVFSYMKGVRTSDAGKYIQPLIKNGYDCIKLDISNYFLSVNPNVIHQAIDDLIEDDFGRDLMHSIFNINAFYDKYGNKYDEYLGIIPGCAISAFLANYILKDIDKYVSSSSLVYARYSDDLIFFTESKENSDKILEQIKIRLDKLGLKINPNKIERLDITKPITFLGLKITRDKIDISEKTFDNIKKSVKSICKRNKGKDFNLVLKRLYKYLYNPSAANSKYTSIMFYVFSNINTTETLYEIDYYIKDRLRQMLTGKNNKGNVIRYPNDKLRDMGYINVFEMYRHFKMGKSIYLQRAWEITYPRKEREYVNPLQRLSPNDDYLMCDLSLSKFIDEYINQGLSFIIKGNKVYPEYLTYDIEKHEIRMNDVIIAKGNKLLYNSFYVCIKGKISNVRFTNPRFSDDEEFNLDKLLMYYIRTSSCSYSLPARSSCKVNTNWNNLREFKDSYFAGSLDMSKFYLDTPKVIRMSEFYRLLYTYVVLHKIEPSELDFIVLSNSYVDLVLRTKWLY